MFIKNSIKQNALAGRLTILLSLCLLSTVFSQGGSWETKTPMPTARFLCRANEINGIIYVTGGTKDSVDTSNGLSTHEAYDPVTDSWTKKADMPGPRIAYGACVLNGKIYAIGGQRRNYSPYLDVVEEYDADTDTWATKTPLPEVIADVTAAAVGNKIYVIGGFGMQPSPEIPLKSLYAFDPITDTWEKKAPLSEAKSGMAVAVYNDKIYVFGGRRGWGSVVSAVEVYDPATDTWTLKKEMPTKRFIACADVVKGLVYVMAGVTTNAPTYNLTATVEVYNPESDTWTSAPDMPNMRAAHASSTFDSKIYVFGGSSTGSPTFTPLATVEEYTPPEPETGPWATKAPMPTPRMIGSASEVNGIIYVIGGTDDPNLSTLIGLATVEAYDPAADTWVKKADMPTPREGLTTCSLNGKIYAIGGQLENYLDYLNIVEEYDPLADKWTTKTPMPDQRELSNAVAVGNKIYVIGGLGTQPVDMNPLASVIAYDTATDTWEYKAPMPTAKCAMGIAVYNDKIYVFGGAEGFGPLVSIVEEYDPAIDTWTRKNDIPTKRWISSSGVVNGKIYAIGGAITGWDTFTPTTTLEIYDPVTDLWDSGTTMPIARMGHASCAVNGKIYVFGGSSESGPNFNIVATVHEFTPTITRIADTTPIKNPTSFLLQQNYPNPFNPTTTIEYSLRQSGRVRLSIYNFFGQHICTLVNEEQNAGVHTRVWNATDASGNRVSSGIYLYRIEFTDMITGREAWRAERKMLLLK